jgi:hypothetical protein
MDEEHTRRRRLKVAGVAAAAVLAVPGGMAISSAFAADGGNAPSSSGAQPTQVPVQSETQPAPQGRGDGNRGPRGDRGDCPGEGDRGSGGNGSGESATPDTSGTAYQLQ